MTGSAVNRVRWICFALTVSGLLVLCARAVTVTLATFRNPHEDLGHGWLVLLVSAMAVWLARARISAAADVPDWRGAVALLVSLGLVWFGERGNQPRLLQLGLIGGVVAVPLTFWGIGVARQFIFPAANLLFVLPLGFLEPMTVRLRLLSTWVATGILNGVGFVAEQAGTLITVKGPYAFTLDIADPWIWLMRSVFAFAAVACGYAWLTQKTLLRKALLCGCFVPLVVLGDSMRVGSTVLVAKTLGRGAHEFYCAWSGCIVLATTLLALVLAGGWIAKVTPEPRAGDVATGPAPDAAGGGRKPRGLLALLPVMLALALTALFLGDLRLATRPATQIEPDNLVAADLPATVEGWPGWRTWHCQNEACCATVSEELRPAAADGSAPSCPTCGKPMAIFSLREMSVLAEHPRILRRSYTCADKRKFLVTVVVTRDSRGSIHRPELCLPLQGAYIQSKKERTLDLGNGRTVDASVVKITRVGEQSMCLVYWFVNPRRETTSHWTRILSDIWQQAVHNRHNRWAMVTVYYAWDADDPESWQRLGRFVGAWYPALIGRRNVITSLPSGT
ncbi:MAG: exosortase/archaeosortase family protein [Kiritimatiellia bacterium]